MGKFSLEITGERPEWQAKRVQTIIETSEIALANGNPRKMVIPIYIGERPVSATHIDVKEQFIFGLRMIAQSAEMQEREQDDPGLDYTLFEQ